MEEERRKKKEERRKKKEHKQRQESPTANKGPSFKSKADDFWQWFPEIEGRLHQTIEDGKCNDLTEETTHHVYQIWESLAWVYGPGEVDKEGHSLTVTGQGIKAGQFLTEYWKSRAPESERWTFYSSRQPGSFSPTSTIVIGEVKFEFGGLWITPKPDEDNEVVNITVWHPAFEEVEEGKKALLSLFLLMKFSANTAPTSG